MHLKALYVAYNKLKTLPESLSQLTGLMHLNMYGSNRIEMPAYLTTFMQLKRLLWNGKVCLHFGRGLTSLEDLCLENGELASADFIAHNRKLKHLYLKE